MHPPLGRLDTGGIAREPRVARTSTSPSRATTLISFDGLPARVGLQSDAYPSRRTNVVAAIVAVAVAVYSVHEAASAQSAWALVTFLIGTLLCCLVLMSSLAFPSAYRPGAVRVIINTAPPRLSLHTPWALALEWTAFAATMLWAGAAVALVLCALGQHGAMAALQQMPRSMLVVFAAAVISLAHMVRKVRQESEEPSGLHLTPQRIITAGEGTLRHVRWRDVAHATVAVHRLLGPHLVLLGADERKLGAVSVRYLGSDPTVTAALVRYFRDHPEERELPADPERAIAQFHRHLERLEGEDAQSGRAARARNGPASARTRERLEWRGCPFAQPWCENVSPRCAESARSRSPTP